MNAPHIVSTLVAPAAAAGARPGAHALRGAAAAPPFLPGAAADEPADFAQLFADALPQERAEAAVPDGGGKEEEQPKQEGAKEQPKDPLLLLGLPAAAAPIAAPLEVPQAKQAPLDALPGSAPPADATPSAPPAVPASVPASAPVRSEAANPKPDEPALDAKPAQADRPAAEAPPPTAASREAGPAPVGQEAHLLAQAADAHRAAPARPSLPVAAPVGTPQWREEFSAAVRVIATERIQAAEIHLNPPELGPVQVSLRVEAKEASVAFAAPHADTRQALQEALPRLRELLEADGLSLGSVSVDVAGSGAFARARDHADGRTQAFAVPVAARAEATAETQAAPLARNLGLVDTFA